LPELLTSARGGEIDAVIVESIDRLSRMTADGTQIERELEERDVALFAADEPLNSSATAILTRRVKQGVAEWYVRDLIERSRAGMEESVRQGWHTGGPAPYGYMLEAHPHPNPQKAREGRHKHRLVVDPDRAPIVLMIFSWYCLRGLGLSTICERLNGDLDRFPPPKRNRKDENDLVQTWSKSQLHFLLRNPKYTGYNVWNRHDKRRGRPQVRPREEWVWSATATHEAIVSRELFDGVEDQARLNGRAANDLTPKDYPAAAQRHRGPALSPSQPRSMQHLWAPHGRQPPEARELVSLSIRAATWNRGGRCRRPPPIARDQRGSGPRRPARLPGRTPFRTRQAAPAQRGAGRLDRRRLGLSRRRA
jgi:DNA invertase Pin-like site-specific DNA recombinase